MPTAPTTTMGTGTFVVVGDLAGKPIPAFVSICNSWSPLSLVVVTDRDIAPAASVLSQSVTVRDQIPRYVLQIKTLGWRPNGSSKSVTVRAIFAGLVLQIEIWQKPRIGTAAKAFPSA